MIEIACLILIALVTWMVASEGICGAAQAFVCTLLAGILAMNLFEPVANLLKGMAPGQDNFWDVVALLGLFAALVFGLRLGAEYLSPRYIQVIPMLDTVGRWVFGAMTGYLTMAIILTALHTAPLPREFLGFKPERANFFGVAPDRQWLGFIQYVTEKPFSRAVYRTPDNKTVIVKAFDGRYKTLGDPNRPYPNTIWPSFPIRYAMRRERIDMGQNAQPPVVIPQVPASQAGPPKQTGTEVGF